MKRPALRSDKEIEEIYTRHISTIYRVCFAYMKNPADTEDAVQDTFFQLVRNGPEFKSAEHEKAWLIRTASNICKNSLRHWWRRRESIDEHHDISAPENMGTDEVFTAVTELPERYKTAVYLYYYEGYDSAETAELLKKPPSTVRNYLREARLLLRAKLGDDFYEEQ